MNSDYEPGVASYTPYNVKDKSCIKKGESNIAHDIHLLKPYSNVCGIIALSKSAVQHHLLDYSKAIQNAAAQAPPAYD